MGMPPSAMRPSKPPSSGMPSSSVSLKSCAACADAWVGAEPLLLEERPSIASFRGPASGRPSMLTSRGPASLPAVSSRGGIETRGRLRTASPQSARSRSGARRSDRPPPRLLRGCPASAYVAGMARDSPHTAQVWGKSHRYSERHWGALATRVRVRAGRTAPWTRIPCRRRIPRRRRRIAYSCWAPMPESSRG